MHACIRLKKKRELLLLLYFKIKIYNFSNNLNGRNKVKKKMIKIEITHN